MLTSDQSNKMREKLRKPFPPEAISPHPTKPYLSTIKAIYITERLNDVFGIGGWDIEHKIISDTADYVTVKGRIIIKGENVDLKTPYQYGGHKKTGTGTEPADGYKSAVTDCQSKCASYLEIGIDVFKGLNNTPPKKEPEKKKSPQKPEPVLDEVKITTPQRKKLWAMMFSKSMDKDLAKQFYDYMQPETKDMASGFIERFDDIFKFWNQNIYDVECTTGEMVPLNSCIKCKDIKTCQQLA